MTAIPCRLCQGRAWPLFSLTVLGRLDVQLYRCERCQSVETERPYWLDISYDRELLSFGNDISVRAKSMEAWVVYVALLFGLRPASTRILDYGAGPGLFVRVLRDLGFLAFAYDPHAESMFASSFLAQVAEKFDMLVAVETWEHFIDPAAELEQLFAPRHDLVVVRTQPYRDEGPGWYYFYPDAGQHVFFYSHKARALIAERFGYQVRSYGDMSIFSRRPMSLAQRKLLDHHRYPLAALKSVLPLAPRPGLGRDDALVIDDFRRRLATAPWSNRVRELETRANKPVSGAPA